jgi:enterochelin esterase family protein
LDDDPTRARLGERGIAMIDEPMGTSPRIERLHRDLANGDTLALDTFWEAVAAEGTPLVEAIPGDRREVLVTFVWRGDADTMTVRVCNDDVLGATPADGAMARLGETNLWHRTYRLAADLRLEYVFAPNDPELAGEKYASWQEKAANLRLDPFNQKRYLIPDDGEHLEWDDFFGAWSSWVKREQSLAELPGAPPQPWVVERPDVPKGHVDKHRLESPMLGNSRVVYVYTPPGHEASSDAGHLLVLFDAWAYRAIIPTPTILDNLIADGSIPPLVAVLVDHPTLDERNGELSFEPPGPAFISYVTGELLAWLHERYRVTSDPGRSIVGGASNGGDTAARIAFARPDLFGGVLSQSGTYGRSPADDPEPEWFARQVAESALRPIRFHLDAGSMETVPGGSGITILQGNRHLRNVLRAKGYDVHHVEFSGAHQPMCWQGTIRDALIWLTTRPP